MLIYLALSSIPQQVGQLESLNNFFFFYANHLNGHIPIYLGNLSNIDNQLSGSIPPEIRKAPQFS